MKMERQCVYILNCFTADLWTIISEHFKRMIHCLDQFSMQLHQPLLNVPSMVCLLNTNWIWHRFIHTDSITEIKHWTPVQSVTITQIHIYLSISTDQSLKHIIQSLWFLSITLSVKRQFLLIRRAIHIFGQTDQANWWSINSMNKTIH